MKSTVESDDSLLLPYSFGGGDETASQPVSCIHHSGPNHFVGIGRYGSNRFGQSTAEQQIERCLAVVRSAIPRLLLAPFVHWKLHRHMRQAHHAGGQSPPEYRYPTLLVKKAHGPHYGLGALSSIGTRVECFGLEPRADHKHGVAEDIGNGAGCNGRRAVYIGGAHVGSAQRSFKVIVERKVNAPKEWDGPEGSAQSTKVTTKAFLLPNVTKKEPYPLVKTTGSSLL